MRVVLAADVGTKVFDEDAFRQAYPALRRFAGVISPADVDPDDVLQEALARALALRPLAQYDMLDSYLRRTMLNVVKNERRRLGRFRRARAQLANDLVLEERYLSDLQDLALVDSRDRAIVYLAYIDGRSFRNVGEIVGCSEASARMRAMRALRRLRKRRGVEAGDG